jgi:hypothetical protein
MYVCMHVCMYVYIYIYIHTYTVVHYMVQVCVRRPHVWVERSCNVRQALVARNSAYTCCIRRRDFSLTVQNSKLTTQHTKQSWHVHRYTYTTCAQLQRQKLLQHMPRYMLHMLTSRVALFPYPNDACLFLRGSSDSCHPYMDVCVVTNASNPHVGTCTSICGACV